MEADNEQAEDEVEQIHLKLAHLSALTSLLQAIKIGSKQVRDGLLQQLLLVPWIYQACNSSHLTHAACCCRYAA